jgi:hypothetical protein
MAGGTIAVDAARRGRGINVATRMMLMLMVTKMQGSRTGFVLAIAGHHCPSGLEWQENEQENGKPATHGRDSIKV